MSDKRKLRWERLDNAGLIFPASHRKSWSNLFRISFTMKDPIDPAILQQAVDHLAPRFPMIVARLQKSSFWYYMEEKPTPPIVRQDSYHPVMHMSRKEFSDCVVRILYYKNRLSAEFFHSATDGTGGMCFTKTLAAEYVRLYYHADVPCTDGIRDLHVPVPKEELEDAFRTSKGPVSAPRDPLNVYRPGGTLETDHFLHDTLGIIDSHQLAAEAKKYGVTVTAYLTALLICCLLEMQAEDVPKRKKRKQVKAQIPVNLRQLYPSQTMRNFVAVANVGVDPRLGDYTFEELVKIVYYQMKLTITEKNMRAIFTPNVAAQENPFVRIMPLPVKNLVMRLVFDRVGENVSCLSISNLGNITLPDSMYPYVERAEFIIGAQATGPYNCGVCSLGDRTFIHLVRDIKEARFEQKFFSRLVELGFHVEIESNDPNI